MNEADTLDSQALARRVHAAFCEHALPALCEYIRIPNKSPAYDPDWEQAGHMDRAVELFARWAREHGPKRARLEVLRSPGRTPLMLFEIPATPGARAGTVLLYGHLDKQPEMVGWRSDLGPFTPVLEGDKLYGRGGGDDGYAMFSALIAIAALEAQGVPHARCVLLIEASEESGSPDLPFYIEQLGERIGAPDLVVCLDSGCGNYEQLWCTTSLRGLLNAELHVRVLREGVHSGLASGVVPSSFRVARILLDRIEDSASGTCKLAALRPEVPAHRVAEARAVARALGDELARAYPFVPGMRPAHDDLTELVLARTFRPTLSITGASGLPELAAAGNVLRPSTALKLSIRLPPHVEASSALSALKQALTDDPPYGAEVRLEHVDAAGGWQAPPVSEWLHAALSRASQRHFGKDVVFMGEGGSIPFMGMLGEKFPAAQFMITGVLGPASNAHGPNEFLHLPTAARVTASVAEVLADHARLTLS